MKTSGSALRGVSTPKLREEAVFPTGASEIVSDGPAEALRDLFLGLCAKSPDEVDVGKIAPEGRFEGVEELRVDGLEHSHFPGDTPEKLPSPFESS